MEKISEKDLYEPIRILLNRMGYDVKAEVNGCDIAAVRGEELIIIEMKRSFCVELVFQAINRQKSADSVYVAVPRPTKGYRTRRWQDTVLLAKRLELGIITVAFTGAGGIAEIALHPAEYTSKNNKKKRAAILREHNSRTGDYNIGGTNKTKLMTAYREQAVHIAALLELHGEMEPKQLRELGASSKTADILRRNYYRWFERNEKKYKLTQDGIDALKQYPALVKHYTS